MTTTLTTPDITTIITWARQQAWSAFAISIADAFDKRGAISEKQATAITNMYLKVANRPKAEAVANPITEPGMYVLNQITYRVKRAKASGNLYAMRYVPEAVTKADRFVYAAGIVKTLQVTDRMTEDQARALGHQFGICCVCGAELTDPVSVERGIGPVCGKRI
jgi:hypothetical protein